MANIKVFNKQFKDRELTILRDNIRIGNYQNFQSHSYMGSNHADVRFISKNNQIISCSISSLKGIYIDLVRDRVMQAVAKNYPGFYGFKFVKIKDKPGFSEMKSTHKHNEKEVRKFEELMFKKICKSEEVTVREHLEFDEQLSNGIYVNVALNFEHLTEKIVDKVIGMVNNYYPIYKGMLYLSEPMSFTYKEAKPHMLLGSALIYQPNIIKDY